MHWPKAFSSKGAVQAPSQAHACVAFVLAVAEVQVQKFVGAASTSAPASFAATSAIGQPGARASRLQRSSKSVEWKRSMQAGAKATNAAPAITPAATTAPLPPMGSVYRTFDSSQRAQRWMAPISTRPNEYVKSRR